MTINTSVSTFIAELRGVKDKTLRALMRFRLDLAMDIMARAQDNVRDGFGADKPGRSPLTVRSAGVSARSSGRGGALFNSIMVERYGAKSLAVVAGGAGVPYAAVQEYGGTIRPKNSQFLTIPYQPAARGRRAREFDLFFTPDAETWEGHLGPALVRRGAQAQFSDGTRTVYEAADVFYVLRRSVRIPERPYMQPAADAATSAKNVRDVLSKHFGSGSFGVVLQ